MSQISNAREVILTSDASGNGWNAAVWDSRNSTLLSGFKNAGAISHGTLQLLSDSYLLGADSTKPRIHIWPLNNPSPLPNVRLTTPGKVNALTCTPNGSYIIAAVGEKIFIWQTCNGKLLACLNKHYQTINCLRTTKDGSLFGSGGEDGLVFVWSLYNVINNENCFPIHAFSDHSLPIRDMHLSHGGVRARLYTISLDRTANIYELGSGTLLVSLIFNVPLTAITVNNIDTELFVGCTNGDIFQCNLREPPRTVEKQMKGNSDDGVQEELVFKAHTSNITALSVSLDCCILLSGSTDGAVLVWDIASRQVLQTIKHNAPVTAAFFSKGFENFHATILKPRLQVQSLQRISDNVGKESIEVISRGRNSMEILDFQSFVQGGVDFQSHSMDEMSRRSQHMKEEIEKLNKINATLYRYSVSCILDKAINEQDTK